MGVAGRDKDLAVGCNIMSYLSYDITRRAHELWVRRGRPIGTPEVDWFGALHEEISGRAHELWVRRGRPIGSPDVDWCLAVYEWRVYQLFKDYWWMPLPAAHEQIAQRAYRFWQDRGCPVGSPDLDWFPALHEEIARRAYKLWEQRECPCGSSDLDWFGAEDYVGWLLTQTPALQARIPEFVERWKAIGLSSAPTDHEAAESAIRRCHDRAAAHGSPDEDAAITRPEKFIWLKSPLAGALAYTLFSECSKARIGTRASIGTSVPSSIRERLRKSVGSAIEPRTWDGIWASVEQAFAAVGGAPAAGDCVHEQGWGKKIRLELGWDVEIIHFRWISGERGIPGEGGVVDAVLDSIGRDLPAVWSDNVVFGSHEAPRLFNYSYFEACGLNDYEIFDGLFEQARHCGWWWPLNGLVIATEKPVSLHLDDGTRIPPQYYAQPVTARQILQEPNAEVRRALIERYGQDRFFLDAGAEVLDHDRKHGAELISINLPDDPERRMVALKLRCPSTSAVYIVRVPPHYLKAREALAWSYGLWDSRDYVLAGES